MSGCEPVTQFDKLGLSVQIAGLPAVWVSASSAVTWFKASPLSLEPLEGVSETHLLLVGQL